MTAEPVPLTCPHVGAAHHPDPSDCEDYNPPPPTDPATLSHAELADIVRRVQRALWADESGRWDDPAMDRYTEWSSDTPEGIAEALNASGLGPWRDPYAMTRPAVGSEARAAALPGLGGERS